jgi:hypothetical protein
MSRSGLRAWMALLRRFCARHGAARNHRALALVAEVEAQLAQEEVRHAAERSAPAR